MVSLLFIRLGDFGLKVVEMVGVVGVLLPGNDRDGMEERRRSKGEHTRDENVRWIGMSPKGLGDLETALFHAGVGEGTSNLFGE